MSEKCVIQGMLTMKRNAKIDILKGIAILLVVLGHTYFAGTRYIYLFHMAAFFIASGYFYKEHHSDSFASFCNSLKGKIKKIWFPFVVWNTIFTLLTNVFITINIYTSDSIVTQYLDESLVSLHSPMSVKEMAVNIIKGLFMAGHTEMGGTFWFLRTLFYISVLYLCISFLIKKLTNKTNIILICQGVISVIFLMTGFFMKKISFDSFGLDLMFSYYCLYFIGVIVGKITPEIEQKLKPHIFLLLSVISAAVLFIMGMFGTIALNKNSYTNPLFLLATSLLGWILLYGVSCSLESITPLKTLFSELGQNSIVIMILHFLFFKPVSLLIALVKGWPMQTIAGFPVSYTGGAWWILYTIVSTSLCILAAYLWKKIHRN